VANFTNLKNLVKEQQVHHHHHHHHHRALCMALIRVKVLKAGISIISAITKKALGQEKQRENKEEGFRRGNGLAS
jgi:hypothetical protein